VTMTFDGMTVVVRPRHQPMSIEQTPGHTPGHPSARDPMFPPTEVGK